MRSDALSSTRWPLAATITSPTFSPALAAVESGCSRVTTAPRACSRPSASAIRSFTSWLSMPSVPRRTAPPVSNCSMMLRARLIGIAEPRPMLPAWLPRGLKLAVLMPISSPRRLTSAPPELPGLIDASVWMKFWKPSPGRLLRPTAETMPEVTVWPTPNGLPTATTKSPTRSWSEFASDSAVSFSAGIFISATSVSASEPRNSAFSSRPSASVTDTSSAPSIT